jgi:hypothetical protein
VLRANEATVAKAIQKEKYTGISEPCVARPVTAMAVIAMEPASKAAAHADSTKVAAYAGTAEAATHMHPTETATASAGKSTAEATNVAPPPPWPPPPRACASVASKPPASVAAINTVIIRASMGSSFACAGACAIARRCVTIFVFIVRHSVFA